MAKRGPKPQADEVRAFKGDPGKRAKAPVPDDQLGASKDAPPSYLVKRAKELWAEIAPGMIRSRLLRESDRAMLAICLDQMAVYWEMSRTLREDGYVIEVMTYAGSERATVIKRAHPLLKAQKDVAATIKDYIDRLGLSPMARTQLMAGLASRLPSPTVQSDQGILPGTQGTAEDPLNFQPLGPAN